MSWWMFTALGNATISAAYFAIAFLIGRGLVPNGEWRRNHLALATTGIFFSCALGHGGHLIHLLTIGDGAHHSDLGLLAFGSWPMAAVDGGTAFVAVSFLWLRLTREEGATGNQMYEDLRERRHRALDLNDDVIQGLVVAKMALDLGDIDEASLTMERTLASSRQLLGQLLEPAGGVNQLRPGDLRRRAASQAR